MRVQRTRHTRAYVQIPNVIAQSSTLTLEALGLLVRLLSLPDANRATVERVTACVPNGRRTVSRAMTELVEAGYVQRARLQDPETGQWVTLTSVTDQPTNHMPTVGEPTEPVLGGYPKGNDLGKNDLPQQPDERPTDEAGDEHQEEGESSPSSNDKAPGTADAVASRALVCLGKLGIHERRLRLSTGEVQRLAPLAAMWLADGFHEMEVITALKRALPARIESAAALVTYRLKNQRPEPQEALPALERPAPALKRSECSDCGRPFRLRGVTDELCVDCRDRA